MDGIVTQTRKQMASSSEILTALVSAAADEGTGAFVLPLRADRVASVRSVLESSSVDEAVLSHAYAWMRKASDDKLDGMVSVLQSVLQLWAGRELARSPVPAGGESAAAGEALLAALLAQPESGWDAVLAGATADAQPGLTRALQARMEAVVLGLANGSYSQRVQAEYLKEIESRVARQWPQ